MNDVSRQAAQGASAPVEMQENRAASFACTAVCCAPGWPISQISSTAACRGFPCFCREHALLLRPPETIICTLLAEMVEGTKLGLYASGYIVVLLKRLGLQ